MVQVDPRALGDREEERGKEKKEFNGEWREIGVYLGARLLRTPISSRKLRRSVLMLRPLLFCEDDAVIRFLPPVPLR